jgi:thioredoxin reductase (NADPH)
MKPNTDTKLFDTDDTWLHKTHLLNYLGIECEDGSSFIAIAGEQVEGEHFHDFDTSGTAQERTLQS